MTMVTRGALPSTLLRALQRFAVRGDSEGYGNVSSLSHGVLLGVAGDADGVSMDAVLPSVVGGVAPVGSFTVWVRGTHDDDEAAERDAAAVIAQQALKAVVSIAPRVALVYVHDTQRLHLFDNAANPLALEIVECAHASDFVATTESLLLRASLSFCVESTAEIAAWQAHLEKPGAVCFQFPEQRARLFNARGERVDAVAARSTQGVESMSALVKIPEKRAVGSMSKSAKKKKANAQLDTWDTTPSTKTNKGSASGGDFLTWDGERTDGAGAYLKTLEYGDIANVQVLHSLSFAASMTMGAAPAPTLRVSRSSRQPSASPVQMQVDALVLVPQSSSVSHVVAALHAELIKQTSALLSALALGASSSGLASAERATALYPHVPLVLWSQHATLHSREAYVDAVFDEAATANVLHTVLARDALKDNYHVLSSTAGAQPKAEALCVFVRENLKSSQLAEFGADSFVQTAVKSAASSVVVAHTTRSQSLTQALAGVDHPVVSIDNVAAWIQSDEGKKLLSNGETDLLVVTIPDEGLKLSVADAKMKLAATALLEAAKDRGVDFALTGDAAQPIVVKDPFSRRSRRLATGQAVTAESIICDAGYLIGLSATGKAYCFSHYVRMTPEILTALIFGFFFLFLAYVGLTALHAIQTPLRYPLHGPPKGKEF